MLRSESGAWTKFLGLFQVEKLKKISLHGGVLGVPACPTFRRDGERDEVLIINNREKPNSPLGSTFQSGGESSARVHLPSQPPRDCYVHCEGEGVRLCMQRSARGQSRAGRMLCLSSSARDDRLGRGWDCGTLCIRLRLRSVKSLHLWTSSVFHVRQEQRETQMPESSESLREARGGHGAARGDKSCPCLSRGPEVTPGRGRTQCPGPARLAAAAQGPALSPAGSGGTDQCLHHRRGGT